MNNKKITNFFLFAIIFLFAVNCQLYAFTAVRPDPADYKPLTPAERRAAERAAKGQPPQSSYDTPSQSSNNYSGGGSSGNTGYNPSGSQPQVESTEPANPTPTPTPTPTRTPEKPGISSKVVVFSFLFLVVFVIVGWYFTRNINFKKLFK